MSERKPSPFKTLLDGEAATLIQAVDDVYQIRFKNRAANAYLVVGSRRTIMIDVGLSTNYRSLVACLNHLGITPEMIDMVVLSHEHLETRWVPLAEVGETIDGRPLPKGYLGAIRQLTDQPRSPSERRV